MLVSILSTVIFWQFLSLVLSIVFVVLAIKVKNYREEIYMFERVLDDNGIDFKPSSMYRAPKDWENKELKNKVRHVFKFKQITRNNNDSDKYYV